VGRKVVRALILIINGAFLFGGFAICWSSSGMQTRISNSGLICINERYMTCCDRVGGTIHGSACLANCNSGFREAYHFQVVAYFIYGIMFIVLGAVPWHKLSGNWSDWFGRNNTTYDALFMACAMCLLVSLVNSVALLSNMFLFEKCYEMGSDVPTSIPSFFRDRMPPVFWVVSCCTSVPGLVQVASLAYYCHRWLVAYVWLHFISS
jgi:hypothetical protein